MTTNLTACQYLLLARCAARRAPRGMGLDEKVPQLYMVPLYSAGLVDFAHDRYTTTATGDTAVVAMLVNLLKACWCAETSASPQEWAASNPAWGQCAVTALVVDNIFHARIVKCEATLPCGRTIGHYYNVVDGQAVDLTRDQFPQGTIFTKGEARRQGFATTREYLLSAATTRARYDRLMAAMADAMEGMWRDGMPL